ncbi:GFA family protein [Marinobacter fonticola]|uniref:GFA family protein n=1 Tax=Marinobacter fonticola TaxID=2603215 RepID=UPI0011E610BE|nr:GFA family protein [Marinobacter fonticola]
MEGQCLCGAVEVQADRRDEIDVCHCSMCRQWGGGPMMTVHCNKNSRLTGLDHVTVYRSSEWAERGFCDTCGTHLFYKLKNSGDYIFPAGLFQKGMDFVMDSQIFIDRKPSYYAFANETPVMTEEDVFALFARQ